MYSDGSATMRAAGAAYECMVESNRPGRTDERFRKLDECSRLTSVPNGTGSGRPSVRDGSESGEVPE